MNEMAEGKFLTRSEMYLKHILGYLVVYFLCFLLVCIPLITIIIIIIIIINRN